MLGVELGVAAGVFSKEMVHSGYFRKFFGVDAYSDHHDTIEYFKALQSIGIFSQYKLIRMRFEEAEGLFADESLDFVYVDGYAHTGEDQGRTIYAWLPKVKVGGVLAGHDYHPDWPAVVGAVNALCYQTGFPLYVTELSREPSAQDFYPSWAVIKQTSVSPSPPSELAELVMRTEAPGRHDPLNDPLSIRLRAAARLALGGRSIRLIKTLIKQTKSEEK